MVQAARSGVQNIAEGSVASGTSRKMELKLTNVARASLEELRLDFEHFLRHRRLPLWPGDDPRRKALVARRCTTADEVAAWVKKVGAVEPAGHAPGSQTPGSEAPDGQNGPDGPDGAVDWGAAKRTPRERRSGGGRPAGTARDVYAGPAANAALVLIGVAVAPLERQVAAQARTYEVEGGFTERLYRVRSEIRRRP